MKRLDWYTPYVTDEPLVESMSPENTVLNAIALAQLMIASVVVTIGEPFRMPFYTNKVHMAVLMCQMGWIFYLIFGAKDKFLVSIENESIPHSMGGIIVGLISLNVFLSAIANYCAERFFGHL